MELSDGTVVERNFSGPLNVVGMYISSDKPFYPGNTGSYRVCSMLFLSHFFHMHSAMLEASE